MTYEQQAYPGAISLFILCGGGGSKGCCLFSESVEMVRDMMARASTEAELQVFVTVTGAVCETSKRATDEFKSDMPTIFDDLVPNWNHLARHQMTEQQLI